MTKSTPLPPGQHRPEHDPGLCLIAMTMVQYYGFKHLGGGGRLQMLEAAVLHHCHGDRGKTVHVRNCRAKERFGHQDSFICLLWK